MDNPAVTIPASQRLDEARSAGEHGMSEKSQKQFALELSKNEHGWRRIVRNFSPSWFSVTMGTGVVASFLLIIPWQASWLYYLSIILFVLNAVLFFSFLIISILRYAIWPEIWVVMIQDSTNSLFLATMPIGFATLVEMWLFVCVPAWGEWAQYVAWAGWMLDSVMAVTVTISMGILLMSASHQRSLDTITAVQLIPIAATIVAAGTGSEVSQYLSNPQHALGTIIASYVLWGLATPMAMCVLVMYYQRLALHKMPPREVIVSVFLPLGPLGFGGYTILNLGKQARDVFPQTGTIDPVAGQVAYVLGFLVALIMWSWALLWLCFALGALVKTALDTGVPFNMGWWGFTFPLGVLSVSTIEIGNCMPSLFFRVLGTIFGVCVVVLWLVIACGTAKGAWNGRLFAAPCLKNLPDHKTAPELAKQDGEKDESFPEIKQNTLVSDTLASPDNDMVSNSPVVGRKA